NRSHVPGAFNSAKHGLIEPVGEAEEFIVVDLHNKRNLMRILTAHNSEHPVGGSNGITAAFDSEFYNIFRIKINRIGSKSRTPAVLNSLIHRKDRAMPGARQTTVI